MYITDDLANIYGWSDQAILKEIGLYIKKKRQEMKMTQDELADKATISRSTLSLLERGEGITLSNFIKLLRILDALYTLSDFKAVKQISPMLLAKEAKVQYRVRKKKGETKDDDFEW